MLKNRACQDAIEQVAPVYRKSARNLVHYHALRSHDLRSIQIKLRNLGISRLANSQGHVKASLLKIQLLLRSLLGKSSSTTKSGLSIKTARGLLAQHTKQLLGYRSKNRRVRIMVTQPTEAADNYQMVLDMVRNGMNCARINCAHDHPEIWEKIILNVKKASKTLGRKVKITMDLAGPKIRTGKIVPGAKVKKFSPTRDELGRVITPAIIRFKAKLTGDNDDRAVPVEAEWLVKLKVGDELQVVDTRNKNRKLSITEVDSQMATAVCYKTSYLATGTIITAQDREASSTLVGEMPAREQSIVLWPGDHMIIHKSPEAGAPAKLDETGKVVEPAHVACQAPQIFDSIKPGEKVLFDDGRIQGTIESCEPDRFEVRITQAKETGAKLKAEKGINFPASNIELSGLTEKDREDLKFIAVHADVVNFSFVNSANDVAQLLAELEKLGVKDQLGIILKIETRKAFNNLTEILLTAMQTKNIGVMIARGDLAVETGWDHIGRVQKEIVSICSAAHVPVVWATQVLENLAKKGLPSRSEITDATSSLKAECVMLNKGDHINEAIQAAG